VNVGFVGLGNMGQLMAANLVKAGHRVVVFNRSPHKAQRFSDDTGAKVSATPAGVVDGADVVISMVFDAQAVHDVYGGPVGIASALGPGQVAVEMGTVGPQAVDWLAGLVAPTGAALLDAPVSGSLVTAESAQLLIMAGGEPAAVERARPALESLGKLIIHVGPLGSGARMKLSVNSVVYGLNQALSEALLLAERCGIDRSTAYDVFASSAIAAPAVLYRRAVFERPGGPVQSLSIRGSEKDLRLALAVADEVGLPMGQARYNASVLSAAAADGFAERDIGEVAQYLRENLV
jgi:3-hydroxyisobutyrate dehydrogenase-like beta-hydroxyacid dehydrogenase